MGKHGTSEFFSVKACVNITEEGCHAGSRGLFRHDLQYMKKMYLLYSEGSVNCQQLVGNSESEICPQAVGDFFSVPWGHHRTLIDKYYETGECETALFYAHKVVEGGWSRHVLKSFIDTSLHLRQGKALTSFSRLLPAPDSDLAQEYGKTGMAAQP